MLPSLLISPYSFSTVPVEPLANEAGAACGGTIPVANAPKEATGAPAAWAFTNVADGDEEVPVTVTVSWFAPTSTVNTSPGYTIGAEPVEVLRENDTAVPTATADCRVTLALGSPSETLPACPISC